MTWTTPRTWVHGETVDTSKLNTHLRDNLLALKSPETDHFEADQGADYTTSSAAFADVDAATMILTITPSQANATVIVGFHGAFEHSLPSSINLELDLDGAPVAGNDGILRIRPTAAGVAGQKCAEFLRLITGLSQAAHTIKLQWKQGGGGGDVATLHAGAGTANGRDVHPQFWVREIS